MILRALRVLSAAGCLAACTTTPSLQVSRATVRLNPVASLVGPSADQVGATVYLTIRGGAKPDRLLAMHSDIADRIELHITRMDGNVMSMEPVAAIEVPASAERSLEPGGAHGMLFGLSRPIAPGDVVTLTLTFEFAGDISVAADVVSP